jgi:hypothetical protein
MLMDHSTVLSHHTACKIPQALALDEHLPLVLFGSEAAAVSVAVKDTARALREQAADDEKWRQKAQQFKKGVSSFSGQDPKHFTKPEVVAALPILVAMLAMCSQYRQH